MTKLSTLSGPLSGNVTFASHTGQRVQGQTALWVRAHVCCCVFVYLCECVRVCCFASVCACIFPFHYLSRFYLSFLVSSLFANKYAREMEVAEPSSQQFRLFGSCWCIQVCVSISALLGWMESWGVVTLVSFFCAIWVDENITAYGWLKVAIEVSLMLVTYCSPHPVPSYTHLTKHIIPFTFNPYIYQSPHTVHSCPHHYTQHLHPTPLTLTLIPLTPHSDKLPQTPGHPPLTPNPPTRTPTVDSFSLNYICKVSTIFTLSSRSPSPFLQAQAIIFA